MLAMRLGGKDERDSTVKCDGMSRSSTLLCYSSIILLYIISLLLDNSSLLWVCGMVGRELGVKYAIDTYNINQSYSSIISIEQ